MPVKNALPYLDEAVDSMLGQTFSDFEFVIRDDGSVDGTRERLRFWASRDERIRLFEGTRSLGPAGSSNWVVGRARAPIIARMDADDISLPDRLRIQFDLLNASSKAVLVGSVWQGIDRTGRVVREPDLTGLRANRFAAPFAHGSIMFRQSAFESVGGYRAACNFWEDLDLYARMAAVGSLLVTVEPLYQHRFSDTSTRLTSTRSSVEQAVDLMFRCREAHERGEDYTPLLNEGNSQSASSKINPQTLLSLGFITLWSGARPPTLAQLLRRGDLRLDRRSAVALVWALWATLSPRTLRAVMRRLLLWRSGRASRELAGVRVCEWRPGGAAPQQEETAASFRRSACA